MNPNPLEKHEFQDEKGGDDAQEQFMRQNLFERQNSKKMQLSKSGQMSKIIEESKDDALGLYLKQRNQNQKLRADLQKLNIKFQSVTNEYRKMLKDANEDRDQIKFQSHLRINKFTEENVRLQKMNANNSEVLQDQMKELFMKNQQIQINFREKGYELQKCQQELTECRNQNAVSQKRIKELTLLLQKAQSNIKEKNHEIDNLGVFLGNEKDEKLMKSLRQKDQQITINRVKLDELNNKLTDSLKRVEQTNNLLQKRQRTIKQKDEQIEKLTQLLKQIINRQSKQNHLSLNKEVETFRELQSSQQKSVSNSQQNMNLQKELDELKNKLKQKQYQLKMKNGYVERLQKRLKNVLKQSEMKSCVINKNWLGPQKTLKINSFVLQNPKELQTLYEMFKSNKKPIGFDLLFRASDYGFDAVNTKQKYCGVAHTVLLAKTEFGKVIGGYTPLKWRIRKENNGQWQYDCSGQSFVFSISNNHKFTLHLPTENKAIYHTNSQGPIFCSSILIADKSNTQNKSWSLYNHPLQYEHSEYKGFNQDSWMKFVGSSDGWFHLEQWEIHRVVFED